MTDIVDPSTRSRMMAGIRGKNTRPELVIRSALHRGGFRFRLHDPRLPGSPDLVFPRYRAVIMVHGCFWHRHRGCAYATTPATRPAFWQRKFSANVDRDRRNRDELVDQGWKVLVVWECGVRHYPERVIRDLVTWVSAEWSGWKEFPECPPRPLETGGEK